MKENPKRIGEGEFREFSGDVISISRESGRDRVFWLNPRVLFIIRTLGKSLPNHKPEGLICLFNILRYNTLYKLYLNIIRYTNINLINLNLIQISNILNIFLFNVSTDLIFNGINYNKYIFLF